MAKRKEITIRSSAAEYLIEDLRFLIEDFTNICSNFEGTDIASNPTSKLRSHFRASSNYFVQNNKKMPASLIFFDKIFAYLKNL